MLAREIAVQSGKGRDRLVRLSERDPEGREEGPSLADSEGLLRGDAHQEAFSILDQNLDDDMKQRNVYRAARIAPAASSTVMSRISWDRDRRSLWLHHLSQHHG
jgi:hypothetical protein